MSWKKVIAVTIAVISIQTFAQQFDATPLTDMCTNGGTYTTKGPSNSLTLNGCLYSSSASNTTPGANHSTLALANLSKIQKLDSNGNPSSTGKIGVAFIGPSLFTDIVCGISNERAPAPTCVTDSFMSYAIAGQSSGIVNPNLTFADGAQAGQGMFNWASPRQTACDTGTPGNSSCTSPWDTFLGNGINNSSYHNRLAQYGLAANQVQVVFLLGIEEPHSRNPLAFMTHSWPCTSTDTNLEACYYEAQAGTVLRLMKTYLPNLQAVYLMSANYGGYDVKSMTPLKSISIDEVCPTGGTCTAGVNYAYSYEYGFVDSHIEACQEQEENGGAACSAPGSLNSSTAAPLILHGPYLWTRACTNGKDESGQCVNGLNVDYYATDGRHPCGVVGETPEPTCTSSTTESGTALMGKMMMAYMLGTGVYNGTQYTIKTGGTFTSWFTSTH